MFFIIGVKQGEAICGLASIMTSEHHELRKRAVGQKPAVLTKCCCSRWSNHNCSLHFSFQQLRLPIPTGNLARSSVFLSSHVIPITEQEKGEDSAGFLSSLID